MVNLIKIELCQEINLVFASSTVLSTEYVSLNDIWDHKNEEENHSYGPSYINMYSRPNNCRIRKSKDHSYDSLNANGSNYIGRLLLSISSSCNKDKNQGHNKDENQGHNKDKNQGHADNESLVLNTTVQIGQFIAICVISDANMIDNRFKNGNIKFQLCFGKENLRLNVLKFSLNNLVQFSKGNNGWNNNMKNVSIYPIRPNQIEQITEKNRKIELPLYLPYNGRKHCLTLEFSTEDTRHIMYKNNFVKKKLKNLVRLLRLLLLIYLVEEKKKVFL